MKKTVIALVCVFAFSSCYRDVEELLYPSSGACDTNGVTYGNTVVLLLQANGCISCHSGGAPSGNILLDNYTSVKAAAQNGKLYGSINHSAGFAPMPQGGNKMSPCQINKIKAWIDAGALNN